ncbi:DUF58 domain-containing protein [Natrinema limicola]|uniref:DUF58 domain-containing protein n=1 Tax=Natrinema limicola JCM 13563 TaxID=1230457 RepID=M0CIU6_9EURY|nr:DUF58 domain-containing protein [Natrinema limicola]ELZ23215.1 hypothetical protein C476_05068 [Natrinema limicola JCM 13563]
MRLTRRGWAVVATAGGAVALSWRFGPRALNAVVVPLVVVLLAGLVTVSRAERPRVTRQPVAEGFVGEHRTVAVTIETDSPLAATVSDAVGEGLSAATRPVAAITLEGEQTVTYDVELTHRGHHRVGPLEIVVSDVVGLVERRFAFTDRIPVFVYPQVHEVGRGVADELQALVGITERREHETFDHLREYHRGDPLRDVHWKSAAKRPDGDLLVREYDENEGTTAVTVAAECVAGRDDELAAAAATVVTVLLEQGLSVGLVVPDGNVPPEAGREHHRTLLGLLAIVDAGELDERTRRAADVVVRTDTDGTTIVADDRELPFDELASGDHQGVTI